MKCPIDESELVMTERQGVEIDYCPKCRGVWLDRGELDKILDRAATAEAQHSPQSRPPDESRYQRDERYKGKHKRHSWLSELFD